MFKVYTINNGKSTADQIPSIEYMNELIKMIEDRFIDGNVEGFPSIKITTEELPVGIKEKPEVLAKEIKTDSNHKFVTDGILNTIVDKPTKFEVERSLDDVKLELKSYMDALYTRIINTPNVINKLRDISTILNEDEIANGLLNTLVCKLNMEDFNIHAESSVHMNNNDRKALNILLKCLVNGFADWDVEDGDYNAIKNKPESLPANGGNADTVANHGIKDLINKDDYDIVIGTSGEKYQKDSCDIYAEDGIIDSEILIPSITSLKNGGIVLFKQGDYVIKLINSCHGSIIFKGVDYRLSCITAYEGISIADSVFKDISLVESKIYIKSNCEIDHVYFTHCTIILFNTENCDITNCIFDNCEFVYEGSIMNNIIKFNRYIHTKPIVYIGGNNIISENI